mmetsp:Transcript_40445/g.114522  ORF Transcript_40445/g.114522 Transcript_40445/m.114522 type:complete len:747 (-) Transcript_40445:91-2331(-)|eukprot:CAMPEP_0117672548 /NCGR_PEP_ID=MMETSP0804-20121206/13966_1 /TAXON_ID=1074897 /ORGANISM="Tetraselmis astigmatica, Strain CCMP880" /LENGTH=746 /DNA_ID=CAMNT_0005481163 /DNA_START=160 /DNA_END=2400 /DNA_ORIENTATION=+
MPPRGLGVLMPKGRKEIEHTRRRLEAEAFLNRRALRQQGKTKSSADGESSNSTRHLQDDPLQTPRESELEPHDIPATVHDSNDEASPESSQGNGGAECIPAWGNASHAEVVADSDARPINLDERRKSRITFAEEALGGSGANQNRPPDLEEQLKVLVETRAFHRFRSARLLRPRTLEYLGFDVDGHPISTEETLKDWRNLDWRGRKHLVHKTLVHHDSSNLAAIISAFIMLTIMVSSTTFCLETMEQFRDYRRAFEWIEAIAVVIFTAEYLLKLVSAPRLLEFVPGPLNVVDLVAIVPWYIERLTQSATQGTSVLRVIRLARLLKLGGRYSKAQVVTKATLSSVDVLGVLLFLIVILVVISSTLIFYCEHPGPDNPDVIPQDFNSIPESFWWSIVTVNTVGYGDVVPLTIWGKLVGSLLMVVGLLVMALPISVIGTNFTAEWMDYKDMLAQQESMRMLPENVKTFESLLAEHATNVEYIISRYTQTEAELDHLRMKLQDKITQNKTHVDLRQRFDQRDADSDNDSDDGNTLGAGTAARNAGFKRLFIREKTANFVDRAHRELLEIQSLEFRIQNRSTYLKELLKATEILRGDHIEDDIRAVRMKYKQLEFIKEETLHLRSNIDEFEQNVRTVDPQAEFSVPPAGRSLSTMDPLTSITASAAWQTLRRYATLAPSRQSRVSPSIPSDGEHQETELSTAPSSGGAGLPSQGNFLAAVSQVAWATSNCSRNLSTQASGVETEHPAESDK